MAEILKQLDGLIDFNIKINGSNISSVVEVQEIYIETEVNRIASASIIVQDGGAIGVENAPFTNSEGKDFIPGSDIEIDLGYDGKKSAVFKGIIVNQRLMIKNGISQLMISCKDKAVNMTKGRFNSIYQNQKDSDILKSIVGKYNLELAIDSSNVEQNVAVQYNCSDWDYIVIRAEINNMLVINSQNKLSIKNILFSNAPKYEVKCSLIVKDIDLSVDSEFLSGSFKLTAWDDKTLEVVTTTIKIDDGLGQGNLTAKKISDVLTNKENNTYTSTYLAEEELKEVGKSLASQAVLGKIQGTIRIPGETKIEAGDIIQLSEFSARFNGKAFISKVSHELQNGEWFTNLTLGKSPKQHARLPDINDVLASGLIPPIQGAQIAVVKQIQEDPDNNFRVLVTLPCFSGVGQDDGIWARLVMPYASSEAGFFFFPEIGDEVVLTFINNDPRFPIVVGSLYSDKNKPKEVPDEKNQFKSIYSKSGINLRFDDVDKILVIETPGGNSISLSDKDEGITINDQNDNKIVMDSSGILMNSPKDISLKATGSIKMTATSSIELKSDSDVKIDGLSITQSANTSFSAKGNASAELSASGQTTIKGAMVMIN